MAFSKKITTLGICFTLAAFSAFAQRPVTDPKHENHYSVKTIDTPEYTIEFSNAHSQQTFTLVKIKITNKTNDYLLYKSNETVFKYGSTDVPVKGGGGMFGKESIYIEPKGIETKTLKVSSGMSNFHVESLKAELKGFYRVSAKGTVVPAANFQLPASKNDFTAGPFECSLLKSKQETGETSAKFNCVYQGDNVAIVSPAKLNVLTKGDQKYANDNRKDKTKLLEPKDDYKFEAVFHIEGKILDMQFATLFIEWNDTFSESKAVPLSSNTADFVLNPEETLLKNK